MKGTFLAAPLLAGAVALGAIGVARTVKSAPAPAPVTCHPPAPNRPDYTCTPGLADPTITQANITSTICRSGYTATVRNVSQSLKKRIYASYGIVHHAPGAYEVDHLISLELA